MEEGLIGIEPKKQQGAQPALLPPLYGRWMDDLLGAPIPHESKATCDDCAMCAKPGDEIGAGHTYFDPAIKCCSIVPDLSNFLVGAILTANGDDPDALQGRESVERRITEEVAVTPLGLFKPPVFKLIYDNIDDAFGRSLTLRCPHYVEDTGRCGIWRHRGSTCVTWFCKHVRGAVGRDFWRTSLERLLNVVERDIAQWCVLEVGLGGKALDELFGPDAEAATNSLTKEHLDNRCDPIRQRRIWGQWYGRERDFFIQCAGLVDPLSWAQVLEICSPEARIYAKFTSRAYERLLSNEIAPALKVGNVQLVQMTTGASRVRTYSPYDPIDVPAEVMELIGYFDGRPTEAALKAIAAEKGTHLDPQLVRKLCDFHLLVPADGASTPENHLQSE
jgi:hypothetical protein